MSSTNDGDPRVLRSRAALIRSATELLDSASPTPSVTEVVARAGTSRPTFYQHFGDLPALYRAAARERLQAVFAPVEVPSPLDPKWNEAVGAALEGILGRLREHQVFFTQLLQGPAGIDVLEDAVDFSTERLVTVSPHASVSAGAIPESTGRFLAAGAIWLTREWLLAADPEPARDLAYRINGLLAAGVVVKRDPATLNSPEGQK